MIISWKPVSQVD